MALRCGTTGPLNQGPQMREKNEDIGKLEIESMIIEIEVKHMVSSRYKNPRNIHVQCSPFITNTVIKVKKAKTRNLYNQVPHLTQDTIWESDKNTRKHHIRESQRSALSQQVITRLQGKDKTV